jgi:hypothetical protein
MSAEAARLAQERFNADRVVPQYEALYESTLRRQAP